MRQTKKQRKQAEAQAHPPPWPTEETYEERELARAQCIRDNAVFDPPFYSGCRVYLVASGTAVKGIILAIITKQIAIPKPWPLDVDGIMPGIHIHWDFSPHCRVGGKTFTRNEIAVCPDQLTIEERLTHKEITIKQHAQKELRGELSNV